LQEAEKQRMLDERAAQQEEASGVLAEVSELTGQNQALNKQFMALAGERRKLAAWHKTYVLLTTRTALPSVLER
jgi:hypothetical protein